MINNFKEFAISNEASVTGGGRAERVAARRAARKAARIAERNSGLLDVDFTVIDVAPTSTSDVEFTELENTPTTF